jgi:hypothetical protein
MCIKREARERSVYIYTARCAAEFDGGSSPPQLDTAGALFLDAVIPVYIK